MRPSAVQTVATTVKAGSSELHADVSIPASPIGLVLFAHGSGSGRHSPRNQSVARALQARRLATVLADLLTAEEEATDRVSGHLRFDVDLLSRRLLLLVDWAREDPALRSLPVGLFGASTGAAAALIAAAIRPGDIASVVSRGGRPDLAGAFLAQVAAPTLLLVGSLDTGVIELNRWARSRMRCPTSLDIVTGATHLFEEPGTLEEVARKAGDWFVRYLVPAQAHAAPMKTTPPQTAC